MGLNLESLNQELETLKTKLAMANQRIAELEENPRSSDDVVPVTKTNLSETPVEIAPLHEADATLKRSVQRIAMILQADKIAIMFYDRESGELRAIPPSVNVEEVKLNHFRVRATHGVSGLVFRESKPVIYHDAVHDPRTEDDHLSILGVSNGICVPLIIEKRDDEHRVIERNTIGVVHAFNKRHGEEFDEEDQHLFERMAKNVASIIANLQLYREVVEERQELLQTFESVSAGLLLVGAEGRIHQMNASARAIFGLNESPVGKMINEVIESDELGATIDGARSASEGAQGEVNVTIGGSDRIYQANAAHVKGDDGRDVGVVVILSDITDLKNIDKMKSSFVAMASHELRTPLTAIKGFSSTLLEGIDDDLYTRDDQKEFLGIVVSECDRLRRLIDDLLNTSRIDAGESLKPNYSEFGLKELMDKVIKVQQQSTQRHILKPAFVDPLPDTIVGDQDKLDQIITNLMNNAIKYAPNGGDVTLHAYVDGDWLQIGVEDQGMGIPADHLAKVFEKFHRVNNEDNRKIYGTGLGLYLVKHLVEQVHMGTIWAESEVGKGSTFWFRIPVKLDVDVAKEANN